VATGDITLENNDRRILEARVRYPVLPHPRRQISRPRTQRPLAACMYTVADRYCVRHLRVAASQLNATLVPGQILCKIVRNRLVRSGSSRQMINVRILFFNKKFKKRI